MPFISEDPIGWASGQTNNYAYVRGNPVQFVDPSGRFGLVGAAFGAVGGALAGWAYASITCGDVTTAIVGGALAGGALGFIGQIPGVTPGSMAVIGGAISLVADVEQQMSAIGTPDFHGYNYGEMVGATIGGAAGSAIGAFAGEGYGAGIGGAVGRSIVEGLADSTNGTVTTMGTQIGVGGNTCHQ